MNNQITSTNHQVMTKYTNSSMGCSLDSLSHWATRELPGYWYLVIVVSGDSS